jgi:hypothetical protein
VLVYILLSLNYRGSHSTPNGQRRGLWNVSLCRCLSLHGIGRGYVFRVNWGDLNAAPGLCCMVSLPADLKMTFFKAEAACHRSFIVDLCKVN